MSSKGCEKFNKFLQDILKVREDLTWIDQAAGDMRSKQLFSESPALREKINAMFYRNEKRVWSQLADRAPIGDEAQNRRKRHSRPTVSGPRLIKPSEKQSPSSHLDYYAAKRVDYQSAPLAPSISPPETPRRQEVAVDSARSATERERETGATDYDVAGDPLDRLLRSINVFPVEEGEEEVKAHGPAESSTKNTDAAMTDKDVAGNANGRAKRSLKSATMNEHEGNEEHSKTDKNIPRLLSSASEGDKYDMNRAMRGELAKEIVDTILNQVKTKEGLKIASRLKIEQNVNYIDSFAIGNPFKKRIETVENVNDTVIVTNTLIRLVHQLISDEVERKACVSLSSDLYDFLQWLITIENFRKDSNILTKQQPAKLIENNGVDEKSNSKVDQWRQKAEILKNLLNEYDELTRREKKKVRGIYEYLTSRLDFVETYIQTLDSHSVS